MAAQGFVAVTRLEVGNVSVGVYAGLVALAVNLAVAAVLGPVLDRAGVARGVDRTGTTLARGRTSEWGA